jgi:hypothetical protein
MKIKQPGYYKSEFPFCGKIGVNCDESVKCEECEFYSADNLYEFFKQYNEPQKKLKSLSMVLI